MDTETIAKNESADVCTEAPDSERHRTFEKLYRQAQDLAALGYIIEKAGRDDDEYLCSIGLMLNRQGEKMCSLLAELEDLDRRPSPAAIQELSRLRAISAMQARMPNTGSEYMATWPFQENDDIAEGAIADLKHVLENSEELRSSNDEQTARLAEDSCSTIDRVRRMLVGLHNEFDCIIEFGGAKGFTGGAA